MSDQAPIGEIQSFIRHLVSAIASASLYSPEHRQVRRLGD